MKSAPWKAHLNEFSTKPFPLCIIKDAFVTTEHSKFMLHMASNYIYEHTPFEFDRRKFQCWHVKCREKVEFSLFQKIVPILIQ